MDKKFRQQMLLITFGVLLFVGLMNFDKVLDGFRFITGLLFPILLGFVLAFILNVPLSGIEKRIYKLCGRLKKTPKPRTVRIISLLCTGVIICLIVVLICSLVIPAIVSSVISLYELIAGKWPEWSRTLSQYNIDTTQITKWLNNFDLNSLGKTIFSSAGGVISSAFGAISSTVSGIAGVGVAIVIMVYTLLFKDELCGQSKKMLAAYTKKPVNDGILHIARLMNKTYSQFLSGQCIESCILGILIFLAFSIFRIPYAGLIGILTTVSAFIPFVGAFLACFIGAFLVLLADPSKFLLCIIVYLVVQFIENQFIYPHVVGSSVGLSPLWTVIAVLIGGKLLGLFGMIFFIPLTAVIYELVKENMNCRLSSRNVTSP